MPEFLKRTLEAYLIFSDRDIDSLQCSYDFSCADATIQVAFVVGVGFDGDRLLSDLVGQRLQAAEALFFDLFELGLVLVDHSLVVIISDDRQSLRKQIVVCEPRLDFDYIALSTEMVHILNQQQFDAAVWALGQSLERLNFRYHIQLTSSLIRHEFTEPTIESTAPTIESTALA